MLRAAAGRCAADTLRVKLALDPTRPPAVRNVALAGLADACGLGSLLERDLEPGTSRRIGQAVSLLHPGLRDLIAQTRAAVDSALLSHRL